jgi:hypothetical protein
LLLVVISEYECDDGIEDQEPSDADEKSKEKYGDWPVAFLSYPREVFDVTAKLIGGMLAIAAGADPQDDREADDKHQDPDYGVN